MDPIWRILPRDFIALTKNKQMAKEMMNNGEGCRMVDVCNMKPVNI